MRRAGVLTVLAAALVVALTVASPAGGARECAGLQVCVPVVGPWVVVPTRSGVARPVAEYQLSCPRRYVVGGLDAELSHRELDLSFYGRLGSPVNPGITTSRAVVFAGKYVGESARAPSYKPYIGCMPARGGGPRVPTSAAAVFPPGEPTIRRVSTARVRPGSRTVSARCRADERLVGASHAVGFFTAAPPTASLASNVTGTRSTRGGRVSVRVRVDAELGDVWAVVQVQAVCAVSQ